MNEQPDPVCSCGKTSEGLCPRCGQDMSVLGQHLAYLKTMQDELCTWHACHPGPWPQLRLNEVREYLEGLLKMDFLVLLVDAVHKGSELVPLKAPEGQCMQWGLSIKSLLDTAGKMRALIRAGRPADGHP